MGYRRANGPPAPPPRPSPRPLKPMDGPRSQLAAEHAALRRVATLVARSAPPDELFGAVAREIGELLDADFSGMLRFEEDGSATTVATWSAHGEHAPVPDRWPTETGDPTTLIAATHRPARVEDWSAVPGPIAAFLRDRLGVRSSVGSPIMVEGRLWGGLAVHSTRSVPLPRDTEARLHSFTELVASAIANIDVRSEVGRLAHEQAALRRVATLVAKEASLDEVFAAVAEEVASVLGTVDCALHKQEDDGTARVIATHTVGASTAFPVGTRLPVDGDGVVARVLREGRSWRVDDYRTVTGAIATRARDSGIRTAAGCPIAVRGRTWGAMVVAGSDVSAFPPEAESRIAQFADLVATAIANAEARAEVARLAAEQAALRRVATLVAEGVAPTAMFDAVAAEMEALLAADQVALSRYEAGAEITIVASRGLQAHRVPPGTRVALDGESVTALVRGTGRPARMEHVAHRRGQIAAIARAVGVRFTVGAPIVVDGRLWGAILSSWIGDEPPADTEERMARFAELLDTAIANADSRDQLNASRARLLSEADEARRRVVRDLHDGAQQRLVHTIVTLKLARRALRAGEAGLEALLDDALEQAERSSEELRELARGILPAVLTRGGLRAGVDTVVERLDLPVEVDIPARRFPAEVEASAYFIVAEALTNVVKHAQAARVRLRASVDGRFLRLEVEDDGVGGADPAGHGLVGLADRVTALGGRLTIESPAGGGTVLAATLPL
jgi:signal transduction histidine kinase